MKYNTKKNKGKNLKKNFKNKTNKKYFGGSQIENTSDNINEINNSNFTDDNPLQEINRQVQQEDSLKNLLPSYQMPSVNLENSELLNKASDLVEGVGVEAIDKLGNSLGLDLTNPEQVNEKLKQINETLTNPDNVAQLKKILSNVAEIGAVGIEAAQPFIDPLIDTTVDKFKTAASEMGEAGVKIALNTAEEIPGVGVIVGTIRNLSNASEAGLAAINAGSEVLKTTSDSINAATKNFNRLIKEKGDLLERTQNSIDSFMNPLKKTSQNYMQQYNTQNYYNPTKNTLRGGRQLKKKHKKTKRNH